MITSRVNVEERFDVITLEVERRTVAALDAAAETALLVAEQAANTPKPIARFAVIRAHNIGTGYSSGVKAGPLTHIFDHGSLGKRNAPLKRSTRKPSWQVNRGENPFTATRHENLGDKGVAPRNIFSRARKAGRAVLLSRLSG